MNLFINWLAMTVFVAWFISEYPRPWHIREVWLMLIALAYGLMTGIML